jgi:predicted class III extradiol MEMO1 family dioxygenase
MLKRKKIFRPHRLPSPVRLSLSFSFLLLFLEAVLIFSRLYQSRQVSSPAVIRAAVITHHLLAQSMIINLGKKLAAEAPIPRIVIIGPNHDEVGDSHLLTDDPALAKLYPVLESTPKLVNNDHACYAPRGVLQSYLPTSSFSCILVSSRITPSEMTDLAGILRSNLGVTGVLVASVDFSHYLPQQNADQNDKISLKYLSAFDSPSLLKLGNNFLDSPYTLAILFKYLKLIGISHFDIINHLNSAQILKTPDLSSTTGYFEIVYY